MTIIRFPIRRSSTVRDQAATLATTVLQIINTALATTVAQELENYLRDMLHAKPRPSGEVPDA